MQLICLLIALSATSVAVHTQPPLLLSTDAGAFVHQIIVEPGDRETRFRQVVSLVRISIPVAFGNINIQSAYMYLEERDSTGTINISGPLDTQVSGEWHMGRALFTGYVNIPTGTDSLDVTEVGLAQNISRNDLNFPIKSFGRGLDLGGALTLAHRINRWAFSIGGGYVVRGRYDPFSTVPNYDPGDELTITAGISHTTGGWTLGFDTAGKLIYVDRLGGEPLFRNGKQLVAKGSLSYETRTIRLDATLTETARLKKLVADLSLDKAMLQEESRCVAHF